MQNDLSFEDWLDQNYDELNAMFAESGRDRELDFNAEDAWEEEYQKYLNKN